MDNCPNYNSLLAARLQQVSSKLNDLTKELKNFITKMGLIFKLTPQQ